MSLDRPEADPVEIGDLDDDSAAESAAAPQVVIRYRERGIPWLLVPPLIALSGAIAVVAAYSVHKYLRHRATADAAAQAAALAAPSIWAIPPPAFGPTDAFGLPVVESAPGLPPTIVAESPAETLIGDAAAAPENSVAAAGAGPEAASGAGAPSPSEPVAAVGFDPAILLEPAGQPSAGTGANAAADPAVAAAGNPAAGPEPVEAARTEAPQPAGIGAALLPPDPRQARQERQRLEAEQRQALEEERLQFHADLREVCRQLPKADRAAPAIKALVDAYHPIVPPKAVAEATKHFGKTGLYARVNLATRLRILRNLGFPEPTLVGVIYDYETGTLGTNAREGPTKDIMYLRSAQILLNNPPTRPATNPRNGPSPAARTAPATTVPTAGPAR